MSLVEKIRQARQSVFELGTHRFTVTRPTDEQALALSRAGASLLEVVKSHVVGWNLTELDIYPGGAGVPAAFDAELWAEWVADQPELWQPLGEYILALYEQHASQKAASAKN